MDNKIIYLDNNATTPVDQRVVNCMLPYFSECYANAGSSHLFGLTIKEAVEGAQNQVADLIGAETGDLIFTSGATEAVNLAIKGFSKNSRKQIVVAATEHKAVLDTCAVMLKEGFTVTRMEVDKQGLISLEDLKTVVTDNTILVCVMLANNETGVIQPIKEIAQITHEKGAFLLSDATQAVGKIPIDVNFQGIDLMPFSAHKFYGPKGIGGLYISREARKLISAEIHGGGQQGNMRSGTLNVPGIVGMGKACEIAFNEMEIDNQRIKSYRDHLEQELLKIDGSFVNGTTEFRLSNTSNICIPGINSEKLILQLQNISVSNGAACSAVTTQPSHVLQAMGLDMAKSFSSIRFSLGRFTTIDEIEQTISKVTELSKLMRNSAY